MIIGVIDSHQVIRMLLFPLFYKTGFAIHFANQLGNPKLTKFIYLLTLKFPRWNAKWNNDCWKALSLEEVSLSRVLRFSLEYLHSPLVLTLKLSVKNQFLVKNYHMRSPQSTETISAVYQTSYCHVIASADASCNDGQTTLLELTANSKSYTKMRTCNGKLLLYFFL